LVGDEPEPGVEVRPARPGEYLNRAVADLILEAYPQRGHAAARDTFARWTTDERYRPDGLLLTGDGTGLSGAALVYAQPYGEAGEPPEAYIADLVVPPRLDDSTAGAVRAALVTAATKAGASLGAAVVRTVARCPHVCDALAAGGLRQVDLARY